MSIQRDFLVVKIKIHAFKVYRPTGTFSLVKTQRKGSKIKEFRRARHK